MNTKSEIKFGHRDIFPALYVSNKTKGLIVLFVSEKEGTIVQAPENGLYSLGEHSHYWDSIFSCTWQRLGSGSTVTLIQD